MDYMIGDLVRILECKYKKHDLAGQIGTVVNVNYQNKSNGTVGLKIDGKKNEYSSSGTFWIKKSQLEKVEEKASNIDFSDYALFMREYICKPVNEIDSLITQIKRVGGYSVRHIEQMIERAGENAMTTVEYLKNVLEFEKQIKKVKPTKNDGGSKEYMKTQKIFDLWYKRNMDLIGQQYEDERQDIINRDPNYKKAEELYQTYIGFVMECEGDTTQDSFDRMHDEDVMLISSHDALRKCLDNHCVKKNEFLHLQDEVKAMLSSCDFYKRELEVLKAYGIIDETGKMAEVV